MRPTYNSLLLEGLFFPLLNFSLPFFYFLLFLFFCCVPYFFSLFILFYFIFIINGLCISLLHKQYAFLYIFLLHCSNFIKICARRCAQIIIYFFLLVDINLNHNVIVTPQTRQGLVHEKTTIQRPVNFSQTFHNCMST
jgi:hypothetical protein